MIIPITLERKVHENKDDWMIFELENSAKVQAAQKQERAPTLTELLYNQTEDEMLTIAELLDQGND
jgi:hypothetical protein